MNETPSATAIFAPIWRRKWLILIVGIVVAGGSYVYYKHKPTQFQLTTQLYLAAGNEEQLGEKGVTAKGTTLAASAQADIINSIVVELVRRQLKAQDRHISKVAAKAKVKAKANSEKSAFITITTEGHDRKAAALLANDVAQAYIKRQHSQYERGIRNAISIARRQLRKIEAPPPVAAGKAKSSTKTTSTSSEGDIIREAQLSTKIDQLEAGLNITAVEQVKPAKPAAAVLVGPEPKKNGLFGFVIGIVLAAIAAFLLGRVDRRLRSLADVEAVFHAQILTALPQVKRPILERDGAPSPARSLIEPLRRLHTTLELGNTLAGEHRARPRSILFLSAEPGDGKSTIAAQLALVEREAGQRAAIVEADFRHPTQARLLAVEERPGLAEALVGTLTLSEALQSVPSAQLQTVAGQAPSAANVATALASHEDGSVAVLVGQAAAANPPALLAGPAITETLRSLAEQFDYTLLDAPSPLEVSDVMSLLMAVDAIVIVARIGHTRERSADRLRQLLAQTPSAPVLGVVANGVERRDIERYGISAATSRSWLARLTRR
jgi:Mrp family chromosome partitioning ATPase/capsular polysaccharide biosynthesis protein